MKKQIKIVLLFIVALAALQSCSRKSNTFVSRNFHALGTKYNILYHGDLALEKGKATINDAYTDDYWNILPIERMQVSEEIKFSDSPKNQDFELAEEKAVKAIQKHGMNINGRERNFQIDEAYLLLGKARYYDQRFLPALDAFNYILHKYPTSDKINQAKIWREKTNLRLENNELAIRNIKRLLKYNKIEKQDLADASAMLAQGFINTKAIDSALVYLDTAAIATRSNHERGRYYFIQGQLYNALGNYEKSNQAFDRVIKLHRKTHRAYYINAHLEKAKHYNYKSNGGNSADFLQHLIDLEENRENRPFRDKIYHQIATYYSNLDNDSIAALYYHKSLDANSDDKQLNALNLTALGDINFDNAKYTEAGGFYNETLENLNENSKAYRVVKRKRDNLEDVIYYENIAITNDSIIKLVNMSEQERLTYFKAYTDNLKAVSKALKEKKEAQERNASAINLNPINSNNNNNKNSSFYFYNTSTVAYGKEEFSRLWGRRSLEDNWRFSNNNIVALVKKNPAIDGASEEDLEDPDFYISKIPSDPLKIETLKTDLNNAYYQLGLIYNERFRKHILAKEQFESLLSNDPEERLVLPAKYNLYKAYNYLKLTTEANDLKQDIISNHSNTRYAQLLKNPQLAISAGENSPENNYHKLSELFEKQEYQKVIAQSDDYIIQYEANPIVPKFELLKASAKGRLYGLKAYEESINFIALNYANTLEGKKADDILKTVIPSITPSTFESQDSAKSYKMIYPFKNKSQADINAYVKTLTNTLSQINSQSYSISKDVYNKNTTFVVIHGIRSVKESELIPNHDNYTLISTPNYTIVQIHKNFDAFLNKKLTK